MESRRTDWTQKGTGWVRGISDTNDYTLKTLEAERNQETESDKTENTNRIETIGETGQIDRLTDIIDRLLQIPILQNDAKAKEIRRELNSRVVNIKKASVHKLLKPNDCDIQILRVKDLLRRFFSYFPSLLGKNYEPNLASSVLDNDTYKALENFHKNYMKKYKNYENYLKNDSGDDDKNVDDDRNVEIDVDTMTALETIVKASENSAYLYRLAKDWIEYIDNCEGKELENFKKVDRLVNVKLIEILGWVKEDLGSIFIPLGNQVFESSEKSTEERLSLKKLLQNVSTSTLKNEIKEQCTSDNLTRILEKEINNKFKDLDLDKTEGGNIYITSEVAFSKNNLLISKNFGDFWKNANDLKDELLESISTLIKGMDEKGDSTVPSTDSTGGKENSQEIHLRKIMGWIDYAEGMMWTFLGKEPLPLLPKFFEKEIIPISPPIPAQVFDLLLCQLKKKSESKEWRNNNPCLSYLVSSQDLFTPIQRNQISEIIIPSLAPLGGCNPKQSICDLIDLPKNLEQNSREVDQSNTLLEEKLKELVQEVQKIQIFNLLLSELKKKSESEEWRNNNPCLSYLVSSQDLLTLTQRNQISEVIIQKLQSESDLQRFIHNLVNPPKNLEQNSRDVDQSNTLLEEKLKELVQEVQKIQDEMSRSNKAFLRKKELLQIDSEKEETREETNTQPQQYYQEHIYLLVKGSQELKTGSNQYYSLPEFVDLSYWCSNIADQGSINSCTAQSGIALIEYFDKRINKSQYTPLSARFLYKATRNFMKRQGDSGAGVREVMKTMIRFGVCPDSHWPYEEEMFDEEPTPFCYSFAQNYQTIKYFRLDKPDGSLAMSRHTLLTQIKALLTAGFPCMFGFSMYSSIYSEENVKKGHIPYPSKELDRLEGGHSLIAVGYDNNKVIENAEGEETVGALLVRNSWGKGYGIGGYGYLPFKYVLKGLTSDWWSLMKSEWIRPDEFGISWDDSGWSNQLCGREHCWCGKH